MEFVGNPRGMVRITHPDLGESFVMPESLEVWVDSGWQAVDDGSEATQDSGESLSSEPSEEN